MPQTLSSEASSATAAAAKIIKSTTLPPSYKIRNLELSDYDNGYLEVLSQLTTVGQITKEDFAAQLERMKNLTNTYHIIVIINDSQKVVASGSLVIEHKFIHSLGMLGHIEDVVVDQNERRGGIGKTLITALKDLAFEEGCYKITLDCSCNNEPFYLKNDFKCNGLQMCIYNNNNNNNNKD